MNGNGHRFGWDTWRRFRQSVAAFLASGDGRRALWMFAALVGFLFVINGLNVVNSYVGRDFISAIEHRDRTGFIRQAWLYVGVFALSTVAAVIYRFVEERLALLWRLWQTRQILDRYLARRAYFFVEDAGRLPNPDQRIAEDVRSFTTTTLSFVLMTLNATITIVAFSGVLWSISPQLFVVAVLYAALGSVLTVLLGRRLVGLNSEQLDREANFRFELMRLRENARSVALLHREDHAHERLLDRLLAVAANTRRMIAVNRNLGFFTNGYNYLMQIIPALIVAPLFMQGDVPFGVITQSAMAFTTLMGAFSLAITQFQQISNYAAVVGRLGRLVDEMEQVEAAPPSPIEIREDNGRLAYEQLTLRRTDGRVLIRDLNLALRAGEQVLITGVHGHAKLALFMATAGLWREGEGRIVRPDPGTILFVPELPYLPTGSLREALWGEDGEQIRRGPAADAEIHAALHLLGLDAIVQQAGGLDAERDWTTLLGVRERAGLVIARVLLAQPRYAFFDRMSVVMDAAQIEHALGVLAAQGITCIVLGKPGDAPSLFDATLEIDADGNCSWRSLRRQPVPA